MVGHIEAFIGAENNFEILQRQFSSPSQYFVLLFHGGYQYFYLLDSIMYVSYNFNFLFAAEYFTVELGHYCLHPLH
jgi:hypothetical protein